MNDVDLWHEMSIEQFNDVVKSCIRRIGRIGVWISVSMNSKGAVNVLCIFTHCIDKCTDLYIKRISGWFWCGSLAKKPLTPGRPDLWSWKVKIIWWFERHGRWIELTSIEGRFSTTATMYYSVKPKLQLNKRPRRSVVEQQLTSSYRDHRSVFFQSKAHGKNPNIDNPDRQLHIYYYSINI